VVRGVTATSRDLIDAVRAGYGLTDDRVRSQVVLLKALWVGWERL
jgi:hypothetical protein